MTPYSVIQNAEKEPDQTEKDLRCDVQIVRTPYYDPRKTFAIPLRRRDREALTA